VLTGSRPTVRRLKDELTKWLVQPDCYRDQFGTWAWIPEVIEQIRNEVSVVIEGSSRNGRGVLKELASPSLYTFRDWRRSGDNECLSEHAREGRSANLAIILHEMREGL
jgi:hypothetical protein